MEKVKNITGGHFGQIRCKSFSSLQGMKNRSTSTTKDKSDGVELNLIPVCESTLLVKDQSHIKNGLGHSEPLAKKQRMNANTERNVSNVKKCNVSSEELTQTKSDVNWQPLSTDEQVDHVSFGNFRAKRTSQDKRHTKHKTFRDEWLDIDIFRDWLDRDPSSPYKARCVACNITINAGKSELEKHAAGARHDRAVYAMHQTRMIQQLAAADAEADQNIVNHVNDTVAEDESSNEDSRPIDVVCVKNTSHPMDTENIIHRNRRNMQEEQLQAINRVATAVESLSNRLSDLLERFCEQQSELIKVLQNFHK